MLAFRAERPLSVQANKLGLGGYSTIWRLNSLALYGHAYTVLFTSTPKGKGGCNGRQLDLFEQLQNRT